MRLSTRGSLTLYTSAGQRKYPTADERDRILGAIGTLSRREVASLCATIMFTGCRVSEALALTAASVDRSQGFITVRSLKKRSNRVAIREIPVPDTLLLLLDRTHELDTTAPNARLWPFSRSRAWQLIKAVMRDAGIAIGPHATPKGLRHGFGMHAVRSGVPINLVQRWLGHARLETTAIYLQAMGPEEREIAARMWTH